MTEEVILGVGSNLGDRALHLITALRDLSAAIDVSRVSSIYESPPAIFEDQPDFLNLVVLGHTGHSPESLLDVIRNIERAGGRKRSFRGAPRTIDIDILLFGDHVVRGKELTIPHPGLRERAFVLVPLSEIAPDRVDPESGKSVDELLRAKSFSPAEARRFAPPPSLEVC